MGLSDFFLQYYSKPKGKKRKTYKFTPDDYDEMRSLIDSFYYKYFNGEILNSNEVHYDSLTDNMNAEYGAGTITSRFVCDLYFYRRTKNIELTYLIFTFIHGVIEGKIRLRIPNRQSTLALNIPISGNGSTNFSHNSNVLTKDIVDQITKFRDHLKKGELLKVETEYQKLYLKLNLQSHPDLLASVNDKFAQLFIWCGDFLKGISLLNTNIDLFRKLGYLRELRDTYWTIILCYDKEEVPDSVYTQTVSFFEQHIRTAIENKDIWSILYLNSSYASYLIENLEFEKADKILFKTTRFCIRNPFSFWVFGFSYDACNYRRKEIIDILGYNPLALIKCIQNKRKVVNKEITDALNDYKTALILLQSKWYLKDNNWWYYIKAAKKGFLKNDLQFHVLKCDQLEAILLFRSGNKRKAHAVLKRSVKKLSKENFELLASKSPKLTPEVLNAPNSRVFADDIKIY